MGLKFRDEVGVEGTLFSKSPSRRPFFQKWLRTSFLKDFPFKFENFIFKRISPVKIEGDFVFGPIHFKGIAYIKLKAISNFEWNCSESILKEFLL